MKHHFGDMLDRSGGHWKFVPNAERHAFHMTEWNSGQNLISIATISGKDSNWELISTFPNLEELTLHSPSNEQLQFSSQLWRLKRLRITHARPKNLEFLARLQNLEEIILEYVSGFDDVSPLGELSSLRALHLENLRRVSDFSGLRNSQSLAYLSIDGTMDWAQPVEEFDFLGSMKSLEYLRLMNVRSPKTSQPLSSLVELKNLSKIIIGMGAFPLEVFAWLEANIPHVEGAVRPAFVKFGGENREINPRDVRFRMPIEQFESHQDLFIGKDGKRYQWVPHQAALLGKGQRGPTGSQQAVDQACEKQAEKYKELVERFSRD
ncbi:hypothetical protein [Altererythrobacter fulvus]|uniref:hypothetical protein n=1 Tax=Caenibius fulvus TaxID=2126012 RepID=UPI00301628AF